MHKHIKDIEDFASCFANCAVETHGDTEELREVAQGMLTGFAWEICEIDQGTANAHHTLEIRWHDDNEWNMESDFSALWQAGRDNASLYSFPTLSDALGVLATFLRVAL